MRKISYLVIIIGLLIMIYPKAAEWNNDRKTAEALESLNTENVLDIPVSQTVQQQNDALTELLNSGEEEDEEEAPPATETETASPSAEASQPAAEESSSKAIATISIDKIKLKLPVLEGATKANMKYAATHLAETTPIGEIGNVAIAAHRAHTKGRLFNRLNEVEIGDKIVLTASGKKYTYTVYKISVVKPTDVTVLNRNNKDRVLTLITCDPLINPTHRLIVQAVMNR